MALLEPALILRQSSLFHNAFLQQTKNSNVTLPDMDETAKKVNAGCGQLSQYDQCQASHCSSHKYSYQVGPGNTPAGHRETATDQGMQGSVFAVSTNYCNRKEKQHFAGCGKRSLKDILKNTNDDHVGEGQLPDADIQISNREQLRTDVNTGLGADTPASLNDDLYYMYGTAFRREEQWMHNSLDNFVYDYQEKALDLSGRSTTRDGSCPENTSPRSSVNSPDAASLSDRNEVEGNVMLNAQSISGFNQSYSRQSSNSSKSYLSTSHFQNGTVPSQNIFSTQRETRHRNVPTVHRPIPIYPQLRYPLFSDSQNLFHIGEHPLQSPFIPSVYEAGNSHISLLHRLHNGPPVSWSPQSVNCECVPKKPEYDCGAVHYFSRFSADPNKRLATDCSSSMRHNNTLAELSPTTARLKQMFPFPNAIPPFGGHSDQLLFHQTILMNAIQKAQFESTSDSEISSKDGVDICDSRHLHCNYSSHQVRETLSTYGDNCYKGDHIPTPVRTQSRLNSDVQFHGHAFRPVYNYKRRQYNSDFTFGQPEVHELSLHSKSNEYMHSSSLSLKQEVNSVSADEKKVDNESFSTCNKFSNHECKNSSSEDVSRGTHSLNKAERLLSSSGSSTIQSSIDYTVTGVNRPAYSYTDNKIWQANECRNVFSQRPQSSNKLKRKLNAADAGNASKQSKQQSIATLVHVTQADDQPNITPTPANNVSLCQTGADMHCVKQYHSKDKSDPQYLCVNGRATCTIEQRCSNKKPFHCDDETVSASANTLQCASASRPRSGSKYSNKLVSHKPGISGFSSVNSIPSRESNGSSFKDYGNRHKGSKKTNEVFTNMILNDNSTQQTTVEQVSTVSKYSTSVCAATHTDQTSLPHNAGRNKHIDRTEKLADKLSETFTDQLCKGISEQTRSPLNLTKDIESRNTEQSRLVVNFNKEERTKAIFDNCKTKRKPRVIKSKQASENTLHCTPTTTTCGSVVSTYPPTCVGGKKNFNMANTVGNKTKSFMCKDCNSKHRSFSALLQHQSRDCQTTIASSTPVHATDCVGSYMRYDTSWVGDKCQCTPCPICKGVFGSKFRVFSHLQRGCYKEKVLPCTRDSFGPDGCESNFTEVTKISGTCKLQCCMFRSQAEKIHERRQSDCRGCSSKDSNIQFLYQPEISQTVLQSSSSDTGDKQKMPHSKTTNKQAPGVSQNMTSAVLDERIRLSSNLLYSTLNKEKYNAQQIVCKKVIINTKDSLRCLPAPSVITEKATSCAPDREVKAAMITKYSKQTNVLPNLEQVKCQADQTAVLPGSYTCNKLAGSQKTFASDPLDDVVEPSIKYNTRDIKVMNTFSVEGDTNLLLNYQKYVSKKTPEINTGKEDVEVKQEMDISVESATMIDQPETSSRFDANPHDQLTLFVAKANEKVKSDVPEDATDISQVKFNVRICEDSKQHRATEECSTHRLYRTILGTTVTSLRDSLLNSAIEALEVNLASVPTCPFAAYTAAEKSSPSVDILLDTNTLKQTTETSSK